MVDSSSQIDILLATYMGESFLRAQLDSLVAQTCEDYRVLIRDDGSTDNTLAIIEKYVEKHPNKIKLISDSSGELGTAGSFLAILKHVSAEYVAFCDQDDVWFPDKVQITLAEMKKNEKKFGKQTPLLVHTDSKVVDETAGIISGSFWKYQNIAPLRRESFNRLLVQNVVTGCTIMINKSLRDLALPIPSEAIMHDWWLALVASAFGKIGHVDQATMLYRQHGANEIGAKNWSLPFVLKNVFGNDGQVREGLLKVQRQAQVFLEKYQDELPEDIRTVVKCYAYIDQRPYLEKVYLLMKHRLFKAGLIRNLGLWAHI